MFEGRGEHTALISISAVLCILGTTLLTAGIFVFYVDEHAGNKAAILAGCGGLAFVLGMLVSQYTKKRARE